MEESMAPPFSTSPRDGGEWVSFTSLPLFSRGNSPWYPSYSRLLPPAEIEPRLLGRPTLSLVAVMTELSLLRVIMYLPKIYNFCYGWSFLGYKTTWM
jgi:hypothetical protein